jgi:hypothetical protein
LRVAYLRFYAVDSAFRAALLSLYQEHCVGQEAILAGSWDLWQIERLSWPEDTCPDGSPLPDEAVWARAYLAAVGELAQHFGLDRLRDGDEEIHAWCQFTAHLRRIDDRPPDPATFGMHRGFGGARPEVGEVVRREVAQTRAPDGEAWTIIDEYRAPIVRVQIEDA